MGLDRVVGLHGDAEVVGATHAFMHRHSDAEGAGLTGLYCRRTDDGLRRSAAFYDVDGWAFGESHRLGSQVLVRIGSFYGRVEGNSADVVYRLIEHET